MTRQTNLKKENLRLWQLLRLWHWLREWLCFSLAIGVPVLMSGYGIQGRILQLFLPKQTVTIQRMNMRILWLDEYCCREGWRRTFCRNTIGWYRGCGRV